MSLNQKNIVNDAIAKDIIELLNSLKYGEIQITIHDSRIVQIDRIEKNRFDDVWAIEKGGGVRQTNIQRADNRS